MSGPTFDNGFPVFGQATNTSATSVSASTPATKGQGRLLIAVVEQVGVNYPTPNITVSGLGLTWTPILHAQRATNDVQWQDHWAAWAPDVVPAGTVTASVAAGQTNAKNLLIGVYAVTGTRDGSADVTKCFGAQQILDNTGSSQITMTGLTPNSLLIGAMTWNFNGSFGAMAGTTFDYSLQETNLQEFFVFEECSNGSAGSQTTGGTRTSNTNALLESVVEVLSWDHPVPNLVGAEGPRPPKPRFEGQIFKAPFVPAPIRPPPYDPGRPDYLYVWRRGKEGANLVAFYAPTPPAPSLWGAALPERFLRPQWNPERSFYAAPTGFFASGPPLDQGWPVTATLQGGNAQALAIETPPTLGGDRLIYLTVAWYSGSTAPGPLTVSGFGLQWFRVLGTDTSAPFIEQEGVDLWAAWAPMALPGGVISVGFANPGATYAVATAYARSQTAGLGDPRLAFGSTFVAEDISGAAAARNTTLATSIGSAAVYGIVDGGDGALTSAPDASIDGSVASPVAIATGSLLGNAASLNVNVGLTGNGTFYAFIAAEILGTGGTAELPWSFVGPLGFTRYPWNPDRTLNAGPAMMLPTPPAPVTDYNHFPSFFARPWWNPERTRVDLPPPALAVVVPRDPVQPTTPTSFMRPIWNPERGGYFEPDRVSYFTPYGILSAPRTVEVNERFVVTLVVSNPLNVPVYVRGVTPWALYNAPSRFGIPAPLGQPSIPSALDAAYQNVGLLKAATGAPVTFTWEAVLFSAGEYHLEAVVALSDGSTFEAQECIVTAAPIG